MRFILFLFLTIALNFNLLAQKAAPGFIVTLERDTIRGFILDGTDAELASAITFKKASSSEEVTYLPTSISSFGFDNGRTFKPFPISKSSNGNDSLVVFVKRSLQGKISMYTLRKGKQDGADVFLENNYSHRTIFLKQPQKNKIVEQNGRTVILESYQHIGALKIIKSDSVINVTNPKKFKYSEKAIKKDIQNYNEQFKNEFPVANYHPQIKYFYDISAGIPVFGPDEVDVAFRAAVYIRKYFTEKSRTISFIRGISYRYSYAEPTIDAGVKDSNKNFRQQWISLIPFGLNFQTNSKIIKPYIYFGVGLGLLWETNMHIENYEDKGYLDEFFIFPLFNVGGGLKIKAGSHFIITEVTPTGNRSGICINLGYSF